MGGGLLPLTVVLLGTTGSGKSSLGNSLLNKEAFVVAHTAASGTAVGKLESGINPLLPDTSISIIDTPGYGDSEGKDQEHLQSTARLLEGEGFVNCFLLVLNGSQVRFDGQIFDMLQAYVRAFGTFFLYNTVVVVTHWEMSVKASRARERKNITQESFAQSWLQELQNKIDLTELDHVIPFVYIDNEMFNNPDGDEEEKWIFEEAQRRIFEYVDNKPLFPCLVVDANVSIKSNLKSKAQRMGLSECTRCGRFFETSKQCLSEETFAGAGASTSTQGVIAAARVARVIEATSKSWSPDIAIKAMSRGWHSSTGVHLFGKLASRVGPLVPVGVGVYRVWQAENNTERVQAVVGTSAGIAGGYGGAAVGVSVGSFILPGIGTVIGGVVGGLIGSFGSQVVAEKVVQTISDEIIGDLCIVCKQ